MPILCIIESVNHTVEKRPKMHEGKSKLDCEANDNSRSAMKLSRKTTTSAVKGKNITGYQRFIEM